MSLQELVRKNFFTQRKDIKQSSGLRLSKPSSTIAVGKAIKPISINIKKKAKNIVIKKNRFPISKMKIIDEDENRESIYD